MNLKNTIYRLTFSFFVMTILSLQALTMTPEKIFSIRSKLGNKLVQVPINDDTMPDDEKFSFNLVRFRFLTTFGKYGFADILKHPKGSDFIKFIINDQELLEELLTSGPLGKKPEKVPGYIFSIWLRYPKILVKPLYKKLACAIALQGAYGGRDDFRYRQGIRLFKYFVESHYKKLLHPVFSTLHTWEMRYVIHRLPLDGALEWMRDNVNLPLKSYTGSCWQISYRLYNDFGDSIHGRDYYMPWQGQVPTWVNRRFHHGVCGTLSTYGTLTTKAHGIPASTMGEPGHCAYCIRFQRGQWQPAYSMSHKRGVHLALWGHTWSYLNLADTALSNRKDTIEASRLAWLASIYRGRKPELAKGLYQAAIKTNPYHLGIWREYIDFLVIAKVFSKNDWNNLSRQLCRSLAKYPLPLWDTICRYGDKGYFKQLAKKEMLNLFSYTHQAMNSSERYNDYYIGEIMSSQVKYLSKDKQAINYFMANVLRAHIPHDYFFVKVLDWGQNMYNKKGWEPAIFINIMSNVLAKNGNKMDKDDMKNVLSRAIIAAEQCGDAKSFHSLSHAARNYRNKPTTSNIKPFPGTLLSAKGLLQISTTSRWDNPVEHWGVLSTHGGGFHTDKEENPWVKVTLSNLGELSGIIICNTGNGKRQLPLSVFVSQDNKEWKKVFSTEKDQAVWSIDLRGKNIRAKYVRAESYHKDKEYFHLKNVLVYGRKLQ